IFACGECDYSQHGGNRLGANSLLSAIYGGMVAGPNAIKYMVDLETHVEDLPDTMFEAKVKEEEEKFEQMMSMRGEENAYQLHQELGKLKTEIVRVRRENDKLIQTEKKNEE